MNDKTIAKAFEHRRLSLRPEALKSLKSLVGQYLTEEILTNIVQIAHDLQVNNNIVELEHIQQIVDMILVGKNTTHKDQTLFKIQESINNSLIFIDPFEMVTQTKHKYIINCQPKDKWMMPIKRLQHIENILKTGNKFIFGISSLEKITINSVGSIPSSTEIIRVLGLIIQIDRNYFISDGQLKQKLNISSATNGNIFQGKQQKGLINIGSVVIITGEWDDISGQFTVFQFSQPYFDIKKQEKQDLKTLLQEDKFGIIQKTKENLPYLFNKNTLTLQQQQALEYYKINTNKVIIYFISNFSIDNLSTIQRLEQILIRAKTFQPTMIFLFGRFTQESIPNKNKVYGTELLSIINQYNKCLFFFVPSFDDFPLACSMPHPPINLHLYFLENVLPENMHSLSNPMRFSINGVRILIIKNDISREMRKQHLLNEQSDYTQVSETVVCQQYLGTFHSDQIAYKWNYDESLILDPSTEFVILCDQTLPQFIHQTQNGTFFINPGDFNAKGYFCTMNRGRDGFKAQACQFL